MSVFSKTLLISLLMLFCSALPRFYSRVKEHSRVVLLVGTGGLLSLYFGDLLPDVLRLGGASSIAIIICVWAVYSAIHVFHLSHHEHEHEHQHRDFQSDKRTEAKGTILILAAMVSHCLSSGMLLVLSHEISTRLATTVFIALVAHKGYEALAFSILLSERVKSPRWYYAGIGTYAASLPAGVLIAIAGTALAGLESSPERLKYFAMVISSVAVGSLLGCMIHDFLIPSLHHVRRKRQDALWLGIGGFLTLLFTMAT